jgi:hypothetical protein
MTIAVDFDGVIHAYRFGWRDGAIYDDPAPDAFVSLELLMDRDSVFIHTSRTPKEVARWIEYRSLGVIKCRTRLPRYWWGKRFGRRKPFWNTRGILLVTDRKFPATMYIDDRAVRFTDWKDIMGQILPG